MVYKKSNHKNNYKNKVLSTRQVANIAKRAVMKAAETKYIGATYDNIQIGPDDVCYLGDVTTLATQGTDNHERIGDSVTSTGLQLKYKIANNNVNRDYYVRFVVFKSDKDELNAITDNFLTNNAGDLLSFTANDDRDLLFSLNRKEMTVLMDKTYLVGKTGSTNLRSAIYCQNKFFKLRGKRFFPVDTDGQSENDNIRFLVVVRDSVGGTVSAGNDIDFLLQSRYFFKDI